MKSFESRRFRLLKSYWVSALQDYCLNLRTVDSDRTVFYSYFGRRFRYSNLPEKFQREKNCYIGRYISLDNQISYSKNLLKPCFIPNTDFIRSINFLFLLCSEFIFYFIYNFFGLRWLSWMIWPVSGSLC